MDMPSAAWFGSPAGRASIFYASLYLTAGVANPFLPIWLKSNGLSAGEIGTVSALPIFVMVLLNMGVGRIADRASDWRQVIVAGAIMAGVTSLGLVFAHSYWVILIVWTLVVVPFQAISPVADAATVRMTRRRGGDFGTIRAWGTIGFIAATIVAGFLLDWHGVGVFVPVIIFVCILRAGASLQLPYFRAGSGVDGPSGGNDRPSRPLVAHRIRELWRPWFLLPLIGAALLQASHMMWMGFGALLWKEAGVPEWVIGPLWSVAPACEIAVMLYFRKLAPRFSARHLLVVACAMGVIRWVGFSFSPPVWGLVILQTLHMGSFALGYLGVIAFIANWTTEDIAAEAQSFFVVIRQIAQVLALTGFGYLVDIAGNGAYWVAALMAGAGGTLVMISLAMISPARERGEAHGHV
jgi:MFS transporter, PPP family, 3-phenylpropionic acid transporter